MKAFVLAAGFGTRLLPVTGNISKVSLSLAGVPVIVRVLRSLRGAGADRFLVNLHHGSASVRRAIERFGENPDYSVESKILGTGGALHQAAGSLADGTFLLVNGDCLYEGIPLDAALRFHRDRGSLATLVLLDMPGDTAYGAVELGAGERIVRIAGLPAAASPGAKGLHFCGIHIIEPELLRHVRPGFSDIVRDIYVPLISAGAPLYGFHTSFLWRDLGAPERFLDAQFDLLAGIVTAPGWNLFGEDCVFESGAEIGPLAELGDGVRLGAGSRVTRSLVCENVVIGSGCRVEGSIIAPEFRLAPGTELRNALAGFVRDKQELRHWDRW